MRWLSIDADPDTNRSAGLHSYHGVTDVPQGLVEFARRRSDLSEHLQDVVVHGSWLSMGCELSAARWSSRCGDGGSRHAGRSRLGLFADVIAIEGHAPGHHCPQDARVLVGQGDDGLLPSGSLLERQHPAADGIGSCVVSV